MPTRKTPAQRKSAGPEVPAVVPHLRALLHTVRCIAQHEDALCTVLHNLRHHPENGPELTAELRALLGELPSRDYLNDLDSVVDALAAESHTASSVVSKSITHRQAK